MNILGNIFQFFLTVVTSIVQLILLPIDAFIAEFLPDLSVGLTKVGDFLDIVATGLGWAISATGIPAAALSLLALFYVFKLTMPLTVWFAKLGVKWYNELKP